MEALQIELIPEDIREECCLCKTRATSRMRITLPVGGAWAVTHLCDAHRNEAVVTISVELRRLFRLTSLGDAVRSKRPFRRACWPQDCWAYIRRSLIGEELVLYHEKHGKDFFWDFRPAPEDTWALDYVLSDSD